MGGSSRFRTRGVPSPQATAKSRRAATRLSADALDWIVLNLARGVAPREIVEALSGAGLPVAAVRRALDELAQSQITPAYVRAVDERARAREICGLPELVGRDACAIVEVSQCPPADVFHRQHWLGNAPLVVRGYVEQWPRPPRFRFEDLRRRFADVEIEVARGRTKLARPDLEFAELRAKMSFGDYLDLVTTAVGNDVYLVARNRAFEDTVIGQLLEEIELPPDLFPPARRGAISFWLGPEGTHTKLHHDGTNNFFCQILGKKRVALVPPSATMVADAATGFYASHSSDEVRRVHPELVHEVELAPGDALFIPVGWWHEVWSLSPSLSLAVVGLRWPGGYDYRPGRPLSQRESLG
ncbi:cupin-like domain-containing protein [Polyangium sp. y55x31]|uniref:cupin-like domain-containing protein n=1 Tax=Polyangium sp. y55x31 TaxID=3042688 RepID=UPI00248290A1|nr:cupin-like domain-containing protein [Polyangium sp. y55x31]MDI1475434.1 cupin-like domain-containing protein [Polyangium sp. y55x31]